jgi:hypothetical protein
MRAEVIFPAAFLALVSWRLYQALAHGTVPVLRGGSRAAREDHPIIYWLFTGLLGVIWASLVLVMVSLIAPRLLPPWLTS